MTVTTEDQVISRRDGIARGGAVGDAEQLYIGQLLAYDGDGYIVDGADTAGFKFAGISRENVDNTEGADGDLSVERFVAGDFFLESVSTLGVDDIGKRVYLYDNMTVGLAGEVTNEVFVGVIVEVTDDGAWIAIHPDMDVLEGLADAHLDGGDSKHDASEIDVEDVAENFDADDVEGALAETITLLASTADGEGAGMVGINDEDDLLAAENVEAAIIELATKMVRVVVACPDVGGGGTDAALTADLFSLNGAALAKEGVFKLTVATTEYDGEETKSSTSTFSNATKGSILSSGAGFAIVKADENGEFACTLANTADETAYIAASTVDGGADANDNGVIVTECVPDDATWAA